MKLHSRTLHRSCVPQTHRPACMWSFCVIDTSFNAAGRWGRQRPSQPSSCSEAIGRRVMFGPQPDRHKHLYLKQVLGYRPRDGRSQGGRWRSIKRMQKRGVEQPDCGYCLSDTMRFCPVGCKYGGIIISSSDRVVCRDTPMRDVADPRVQNRYRRRETPLRHICQPNSIP